MNLSMLGFFKYGNFLLENFKWLMAQIGVAYQPPHLDILLPVGISFYTFHSLSYTLDVYRGVMQPTKSLRDFVLAVSFFPQLVAGPIVRAGDFLPQLVSPPRPQTGRFLWGLAMMTLGLFEKVVLADTMLSGSADQSIRLRWSAHRARFLDGRYRLRGANLFRFRRLFDLRDRRGALSRLSLEGQLQISLCRHRLFGFLATLAHFAFHLPARLPLFSSRRQPGWMGPRRNQSRDCHVPRRPLAWRGLDICRLGITPRFLSGGRAHVASYRRRTSVGR